MAKRRPPPLTWKKAREDAGLSLDDAIYELRQRVPRSLCFTRSTLARFEKLGKGGNPVALNELAQIYGVALDAIDEQLALEFDQLLLLVSEYAPRDSNPEPADIADPRNVTLGTTPDPMSHRSAA